MPLFAPIDAAGFATLLVQAGSWLDEVTRHTKRKALFAGQTLYYLGTTVAAVETLENELRGLFAPFVRFDEDWSIDERAAVFDRINAWVHDFTITTAIERNLPALVDSMRHLEDAGFEPYDALYHALWKTITIAEDILEALRGTGDRMSEVFKFPELQAFWRAMRDATTAADVNEVVEAARVALGEFDAYTLSQYFGEARALTLRKHPSLPRPAWSDALG